MRIWVTTKSAPVSAVLQVGRRGDLHARAGALPHALAERCDGFESVAAHVVQHDLGQADPIRGFDDAGEQLRGVGAPASNDSQLHRATSLSSPADTQRIPSQLAKTRSYVDPPSDRNRRLRVHRRLSRARPQKNVGAEVVAVYGRNAEKRAAFADKYGIAKSFESADAVAEDPEIDAVVNALPNRFHAPLSVQWMQAGKHVLVEKPMAMNAAEAVEMNVVAERTQRTLLVGHMWRFDREAQWLRSQVDAGILGRVIKTKGYGIHVNWGPSGWFVDPELAGGGALIDMGVHAIDTVRYLLGDPDPVRVYARISTEYGDYKVDDSGILVIDWSNGATSIIESGWWNPWMDGPEASTQLFGTTGYGRLFPTAMTRIEDHQPHPVAVDFPARAEHCDQHMFDGQMAEFVAAIREGRAPAASGDAGLQVMRICDAAYESALTKKAVELSE